MYLNQNLQFLLNNWTIYFVDLWQQDTLRFGLPTISDPDSTIFKVSLVNNAPDWVKIEAVDAKSLTSNASFNVSFVSCEL